MTPPPKIFFLKLKFLSISIALKGLKVTKNNGITWHQVVNYKEVQENADKLEKVRKQILKLVHNTYSIYEIL